MSEKNKKKIEISFFVDESYSNNFCGVCIVCVQGEKNLKLIHEQVCRLSLDPAVIIHDRSSRFHYVDDSIGARQSLAPWISRMPISVYIALTQTNIPNTKQDRDQLAYGTLFPELLKPLRMKFSNRLGKDVNFLINFENLTDKPNQDLSFFENILNTIPSCRDMKYAVVNKENEQLSFLPDYFLGFVRDHFSEIENQTWPADSLKLLSEKIGVLLVWRRGIIERYERGEELYNFLS